MRCFHFGLCIVSEAKLLRGPTSEWRHECTRITHRYVKADIQKNENARPQFAEVDGRLRRFGSPNSPAPFLQMR
jgi:hypothetical protein